MGVFSSAGALVSEDGELLGAEREAGGDAGAKAEDLSRGFALRAKTGGALWEEERIVERRDRQQLDVNPGAMGESKRWLRAASTGVDRIP